MAAPQPSRQVVSTGRTVGPWGAIGVVVAFAAVSGLFSPGGDATLTLAAAPQTEVGQSPGSAEDLYTRIAPSVVTIYVKDQDDQYITTGSGFILHESALSHRHACAAEGEALFDFPIDTPDDPVDEPIDFPLDWLSDALHEVSDQAPDDSPSALPTRLVHVVTNHHVIESAVTAEVQLASGAVGTVERVIAEDGERDLALLAVNITADEPACGIRLSAIDPPILTLVYAIGSPRGLTGTASMGHVSSYRNRGGQDWLQTTAPISPGSSGGPLLLADGTVAGVTTMTLRESQNLNFAVPASAVHAFLFHAATSSRDLAEGTSLAWHEEEAFRQLRTATRSSDDADARKQQVVLLDAARNELQRAIAKEPNASYEWAISLAEFASATLPREFRYLSHFLVGEANYHLAVADASGAHGAEEAHIRYLASPHAAQALARLEQATKLKPDFPPAHACLAHHHAKSGNWPAALLASGEVVRLMPRCGEALAHRAECFAQLGQPESARQDLEAATSLSPCDGRLHYELAKVLAELGEYDEAIESYATALYCNPPNIRDAIHYHLAVAYRHAGNHRKASIEFTKAKALGWPAEQCDAALAACGEHAASSTVSAPVSATARILDAPGGPIDAPGSLVSVSTSEVEAAPVQITVYVTKTGKKYHRDGCPHLSRSKIPLPLAEAARLYAPCAHCLPPTR